MQFGSTYSAACRTYWVIRDFPVISPDEIFPASFRIDSTINNLEREVRLDHLGGKRLSIMRIHG